jgi:hypothetical protein
VSPDCKEADVTNVWTGAGAGLDTITNGTLFYSYTTCGVVPEDYALTEKCPYVKKEEPKREEPNITTEDPGPPVPQTMETVLTDGFDIPVLEDYWEGPADDLEGSREVGGGRYCRIDSQWCAQSMPAWVNSPAGEYGEWQGLSCFTHFATISHDTFRAGVDRLVPNFFMHLTLMMHERGMYTEMPFKSMCQLCPGTCQSLSGECGCSAGFEMPPLAQSAGVLMAGGALGFALMVLVYGLDQGAI